MSGVAGAIGTKADQVMETLDETVRGAIDKVFAELVQLDRDRTPTRKRASLATFATEEGAITLIQALAGSDCRVLVTSGEKNDSTVEVAHEKLFTAWPRLKKWLDQGGDALRLIELAREEASGWRERGEMAEELWPVTRVTETLNALQRFGKSPSPELDRFLRPQQVLLEQLHQDDLSHEQRAVIGWKLTLFGDPRPGVGLCEDGLPDIAWVEIPPGQIQLEGVDHVFEVKAFRLAKYPVTNAQFQAFIDNDGYETKKWWQGIKERELQSSSWKESNAPRECVSWFEAVAFCRWLSHRMGSLIRLPTEWEWQQAATEGKPAYDYPWGKDWDTARSNSVESRLSRSTAVGLYPRGVTPNGVLDMTGNVWEWCLNKPDHPEKPESVNIDDDDWRALRGGCWQSSSEFLRTSFRKRSFVEFQVSGFGFRLAQDIP